MSYYGWETRRWPKWTAARERWLTHEVPEVEIRRFRVGEDYAKCPWFDKSRNCQYLGSSPPQGDTAAHLCISLGNDKAELRDAYKLYAFCRQERVEGFPIYVLREVFERHGSALYQWWNGNAKYVLPPLGYSDVAKLSADEQDDWRDLVDRAAATWLRVAQQWAVIRIPEFMDWEDPDFLAYREQVSQMSEAMERAEYERLKRKFESTPAGE